MVSANNGFMTSSKQWYANPAARSFRTPPAPQEVLAFHQAALGYSPTRLKESRELATDLGVRQVFVKEESVRFGLPAFKMVGVLWSVYRILSARTGEAGENWSFDELADRFGGKLTLYCATDGNHGRAVAHTASLFGLSARVFVPSSISQAAKDGIRGEGAELTEVQAPYDDVVPHADAAAEADPAGQLVQDTAWEGYDQIPTWIVEGYSTIFRELDSQLEDAGVAGPDVVVTPCGVGSLLQATVAHYRGNDRPTDTPQPSLLSVEPLEAGCLVESLNAGGRVSVETGSTHMAGLNCGTVSTIAWPVLRGGVDAAVLVPENADISAVHRLEELGFDSGPCGAASLAGLHVAFDNPELRESMGVSGDSVVVLLSTESREANPLD
ncbi:diaminopropionate ammonia-lyase [Arthrobacter roseus]